MVVKVVIAPLAAGASAGATDAAKAAVVDAYSNKPAARRRCGMVVSVGCLGAFQ